MADVLRFPAERTVRQAWPPPSNTSFDGVADLRDHPLRAEVLGEHPTDTEPGDDDGE